tara:strand:+ start:149 stop:529 length:381 start_codon:yes stop_codon:yes gene_type:complete
MVDGIFEIFNQIVDVISGENSLIDFYYFLNDPFYGMLFLSLIIVLAYGSVLIYAIIFPKKKEETEQEKLERLRKESPFLKLFENIPSKKGKTTKKSRWRQLVDNTPYSKPKKGGFIIMKRNKPKSK